MLERVERDCQRQHESRERQFLDPEQIQILDNKIGVFENDQQAKIESYPASQKHTAITAGKPFSDRKIDADRNRNNQQIVRRVPSIEKSRRSDQERQGCIQARAEVQYDKPQPNKRQKQEEKLDRLKEHQRA
ncbi:MAG: hypothetical protein ACKVKG_20625 [Alphaproteobacteria bacterium]